MKEACESCKGTGKDITDQDKPCSMCNGTGEVEYPDEDDIISGW